MAKTVQASMVGLIAGNLRELRKRGLTSADLLCLEKLAILSLKGRGIVRVSDVGRLLGIGRAGAHKRLKRLILGEVVVKVGRCVMLNVRGLLAMDAEAAKCRMARARELFSWERMPKRFRPAPDTRQTDRKEAESEESGLVWTVQDEMRLKAAQSPAAMMARRAAAGLI